MKYLTTIALLVLAGLTANAGELEEWLLVAARDGNLSGVNQMLERGADKNAKSRYGWTALMWANDRGNWGIARILEQHN